MKNVPHQPKLISNYLHFYLGAPCKTDDGKYGRFAGLDLCQNNNSITMLTVRYSDNIDDPEASFDVYNDNHELDRIKLLLYPMVEITTEDALTVARLATGNVVDSITRIDRTETIDRVEIFCNNTSEKIDIRPNSIEWMEKTKNWVYLPAYNYAEIVRFLTSKQYDVFGLLKDGLAIKIRKAENLKS